MTVTVSETVHTIIVISGVPADSRSVCRHIPARMEAALMLKKRRRSRLPLWSWSYNNPNWDRRVTKIHDSMKELDDFLGSKKPGKRKMKKM